MAGGLGFTLVIPQNHAWSCSQGLIWLWPPTPESHRAPFSHTNPKIPQDQPWSGLEGTSGAHLVQPPCSHWVLWPDGFKISPGKETSNRICDSWFWEIPHPAFGRKWGRKVCIWINVFCIFLVQNIHHFHKKKVIKEFIGFNIPPFFWPMALTSVTVQILGAGLSRAPEQTRLVNLRKTWCRIYQQHEI